MWTPSGSSASSAGPSVVSWRRLGMTSFASQTPPFGPFLYPKAKPGEIAAQYGDRRCLRPARADRVSSFALRTMRAIPAFPQIPHKDVGRRWQIGNDKKRQEACVFQVGCRLSTSVYGRIAAHGRQDVYGSTAGATVSVTASQIVHSGGSASGTVVVGGTEIVSAGGTTTGTTIRRYFSSTFLSQVSINGSEIVSSGGVASGTIVGSGGEQYVLGRAGDAFISLGGAELAGSGGPA